MRLSRLDLRRYGKFTDQSISLPNTAKDFHLIVGPNEAGKSTLRNAIQDLLFGIETRSRYNFLHPHSEMCLAALIEQGDERLDFIRTKARTKTLQSAAGKVLSDDALAPFLGQVDRAFFDQMFGLNHERLVSGGQEILSASNDIGQILFQAAAGIGSLGEIRDRLEKEADTLWAKRKSNDREYYIASAELDLAEVALKHATVRTKDWQEARNGADRIGYDLKQARERYQVLEQERIQLERVRRVAPMLTRINDLERQLADLGETISLPETAAGQLTAAESEVAVATQSLSHFDKQVKDLQERMQKLNPDETLLTRTVDIESLAERRQQLRNHEGDIGKREEEVRVLWKVVQESMRQLGVTADNEDAVVQRLPDSLVRSSIDNLVRRHDALVQARTAAEDAFRTREEEVKVIDAEIDGLPSTEIPVTLLDALTTARALGDVGAQEKRIATQIARLKRELDTTVLELGRWNAGPDVLRALLPPTLDETNALIKRRNELELGVSTIKARHAEINGEIKLLQLEISHYKAAHHPVTLADVQQVRAVRDTTWQAIKAGASTLSEAAPNYEKEVADSDALSDQRHDKVQEEAELHSRLDRLQRLHQQADDLQLRLQESLEALTLFDKTWGDRVKELGLDGMALLQVNDWRSARERVLRSADALAEAQSSQADLVEGVAHAKSALADAVLFSRPDAQNLTLSALILLADDMVVTTTRSQERRRTLATQKIRAEAGIPDLNNRVLQAHSAIDVWRKDLQKNLAVAHLSPDADIGTIEGALDLFERIDQHLQKIRDIRISRIDMMRRDLKDFEAAAKSLASDIAPAMALEPAATIALSLMSHLKQALSSSQELARLQAEFDEAVKQATDSSSRIAKAKASLEPLLRLSGTPDNDALRLAITNSDRLRSLSSEMDQTMKQLLEAGDGWDRDELDAEFKAADANSTPIRLSEIKQQLDEIVTHQNRLSGELTSADAALARISGQDDAACAESLRQQALARMSNAAERYIKVYTAARLLRWSIERFRESKQGPMLSRASEVFCGLTEGGFNKLTVDYESEPLKLSGLRTTGELVDIEGMSEGTRDQLYLALRMAALELHLEQTVPLPFIADDLFINYDDGRARAGLEALARLSEMTQVIFLSHHEHLVPLARSVFGDRLNVLALS